MRNLGRFRITEEALVDIIKSISDIPSDFRASAVHYNHENRTFDVVGKSDSFPDSPEGSEIPRFGHVKRKLDIAAAKSNLVMLESIEKEFSS